MHIFFNIIDLPYGNTLLNTLNTARITYMKKN